MKNKELVLSEAIKRGKWVDISYVNRQGETTYYWIAIKDIDLKEKRLICSLFNETKSLDSLFDKSIRFDGIVTARILEFTNYDVPEALIQKLEKEREDSKWLMYETFNNNILRYYYKCNELDNDPFQIDSFLITGIDRYTLLNKKRIILNEEQEIQVINYIKRYDRNKDSIVNSLALAFLSIESNFKKYVVLYYKIRFNPDNKELSIDDTPRINASFLIEGKRHSLDYYLDIDPEEFVHNITTDLDNYLSTYTELLRANLKDGEIINQMPEFMILSRNITANLGPTYSVIEKKIENNELEYPLKALFGNTRRFADRRKEPQIVIYDNKVNIDQMRVIYNSMKFPINYVQGPPGTGKTQTILNVILSQFYNSKTMLVCSSNNKPIDGIISKLEFDYNGITVPFPYLRLGNRDEVLKATYRINELYNYNTDIQVNEELIDSIKNRTNNNNKELIKKIELYESKRELWHRLKSATDLYTAIKSNTNNRLLKQTELELEKIMNDYKSIPKIPNEEVQKLAYSVSSDNSFKEYLYYESIKYIKKLKQPRYADLITICNLENEETRVTEFNRWCSIDENIRLLEDVFPLLITTNISASRLGTPYHTFDLVIMDEAGQCNVATAILPIARAKQLLLVGDTNQLKPVIVLEDTINQTLKDEFKINEDYDYSTHSILDIMKTHDKISNDIMLSYHYRCGKKIIDFSNKRFYDNKLHLDYIKDEGILTLIDVKNMNSKNKNENYEEAQAIVDYVKRNNLDDIAIITPFKNQQNLINNLLNENGISDITCGTIHKVQGGEKNTIIISTSLSPKTSRKTFEWIKNNAEITNVAVTRAKKNLIVVADTESLDKLSTDKKDDLYNLVRYVKANGNIDVPLNESYSVQIGKSNGSTNEDMFYRTISHFCSVNSVFQAKRNVKLSELFSFDPILSKSKLEFDVVLYQIDDTRLIPKIAIELQGGEHFGNVDREKCDTRKSEICKEKDITLLEIPNSFAKSYETIKELILSCCGIELEQLTLI